MTVADGRFGSFLRCSRYPACKSLRALALGVVCPRAGCDGALEERRSRDGKVIFGCSNHATTQCDVCMSDRPVPTPCPHCGAAFVVRRAVRRGAVELRCLACRYRTADTVDLGARREANG